MVNEVHQKLLVAITDLDMDTNFADLDSLADGDLAWSAPVTSTEDAQLIDIFSELKTGTSPTDGGTIGVYVGFADDGTGEIRSGSDDISTTDHGTETVDADIDRVLPQCTRIGTIIVDNTSDKVYSAKFQFAFPGADWFLLIHNDTGAAFNGTGSPHTVRYRAWGPEIQ